MSLAPDEPYSPRDWENSHSAKADAHYALKNQDQRLLGFALRGYSVPGIESQDQKKFIDKCGIRTFHGMGDAVRSSEQLASMQKARKYAEEYNAIIKQACQPD